MELSSDISAIVTGGASGLGAATALMLATYGVKVAIFDLNPPAPSVLQRSEFLFCSVDVTDQNSVMTALEKARLHQGQERILVNCAGIAPGEKIAWRDKKTGESHAHRLDLLRKVIEVNLIGTLYMVSCCAASMLTLDPLGSDLERGVIINTASIAAVEGQVGQVAYAASKGGILGATLPIARDLAQNGIRCCTIMPGVFKTPMVEGFSEEVQRGLAQNIPFPKRLGLPDDYARLACHIIQNTMLNGESIRLDGALRMQPKG